MGDQHLEYKAQELHAPCPLILCGPGLTLETSVLLQQWQEGCLKTKPSFLHDVCGILPGHTQIHPVAQLSSASFTNSKNQNVDVT